MEANRTCCWSTCFPSCIKRRGTFSCFRRHRNRVGPSNPMILTIPKDDRPETPLEESAHTERNGETNLYFQGDEVTFCSPEDTINGEIQNQSHEPNGDCLKDLAPDAKDRIQPGEEPESPLTQGFYEFLSTIFIQLSKSKRLRVIHIENKRVNGEATVQNTSKGMNEPQSDSEDDEDYWFSKWSRRPKLKNTFKPTRSSQPLQEIVIELNGRTKFSFEDLKDPDLDSERLRKSYSAPLFNSEVDGDAGGISFEVNSRQKDDAPPESHHTKPEHYDAEWPPEETDEPDLNPREERMVHEESPAFTNFGFQLEDPDESCDIQSEHKLDENVESPRTDRIIFFPRGDNQTNGVCVPCAQSSQFQEEVKSNGFIRNLSSPSGIERKEITGNNNDSIEESPVDMNTKPLLFFIHGISGSSDVWRSQFKFFHDLGYEIVAPDLLGHGMSSTPNKPKHYLFESLVQDLLVVFDHFANESRMSVVIGHGYGACMGSLISRLRSQNVILLISVSGGGPTPLIPYGCMDRPILPFRLNIFNKKETIGRFDNPDLRHILPESIHEHILKGQLWVDGDAAFHRRISVPTLLVYGMRDTVVSLIEECEMERTIPKSFLELLPSAGHMVMWDEDFNRMLIKFIKAWT